MALDPNVQVAIVTTFATAITTTGVIVVARMNNRKERGNAASAGVEAGAALDEGDVLKRMLSLISEVDRKEQTIVRLRAELSAVLEELETFRGKGTQ